MQWLMYAACLEIRLNETDTVKYWKCSLKDKSLAEGTWAKDSVSAYTVQSPDNRLRLYEKQKVKSINTKASTKKY